MLHIWLVRWHKDNAPYLVGSVDNVTEVMLHIWLVRWHKDNAPYLVGMVALR